MTPAKKKQVQDDEVQQRMHQFSVVVVTKNLE